MILDQLPSLHATTPTATNLNYVTAVSSPWYQTPVYVVFTAFFVVWTAWVTYMWLKWWSRPWWGGLIFVFAGVAMTAWSISQLVGVEILPSNWQEIEETVFASAWFFTLYGVVLAALVSCAWIFRHSPHVHIGAPFGLKGLFIIIFLGLGVVFTMLGTLGLFDYTFVVYAQNVNWAMNKAEQVAGLLGALIAFLFCVYLWIGALTKDSDTSRGSLVSFILMMLTGVSVVAWLVDIL
jgi:hypothetical protein